MVTDESTYQLLSPGQPENFRAKSFAWRLAVVVSAVCGCLFNAGVVFGYSAIFPELVAHGAFRDKCQDETAHEPCSAQVQALTGMFTLATSMLNVLSIVSGALLDRAGPRWTAGGAALCVAAGALLFSTGGPGKWEMGYRAGFLLLGVSGPVVFVSSLSFANLFPGREGLCTAALVGCFDASSAVFVGLSWLIKSGVSFETTFRGYALLPACTALVALFIWPWGPVRKASVRISSSSAGGDGCSLAALPLGQQARSIEYFLLVQTISIGMVCINFFIATCDLQMLRVDTETASTLGQAFAAMLPLGGQHTPHPPSAHLPGPDFARVMSIAGEKWIREEGSDWVLHENVASLTGDSFTVKNYDSGEVAIKANAAIFSLKDCIQLLDAETDEELCTIKSTFLHMLPTYQVLRDGEVVATVRKDRFSIHKTIRVYEGDASFNPITNTTSAPCLLQLHGGMIFERNTEIYRGDTDDKVGYVHEKRFDIGGLFGQDEYAVRVEAGGDIVLILAAMIVKDEITETQEAAQAAEDAEAAEAAAAAADTTDG